MKNVTVEDIAKLAHNVNRAYCIATADEMAMLDWEHAPEWQKSSCLAGVKYHLDNPHANASDSHEKWLAHKASEGWKWGTEKNEHLKTHPCFMPYSQLPQAQKVKDYLFKGVVDSMRKDYEAHNLS